MNASSAMRKLIEACSGRVEVYLVYIREAHPADGDWAMGPKKLNEPRSYEERVAAAGGCRQTLDLAVTVLVDDMQDSVGRAYNAWPERMFLIDTAGVIRFKMAVGPMGFKPRQAQEFIEGYFKR